MRKNIAGQYISFQMISSTDGSDVTSGTPTVYYTIDAGTQGTGAGAAIHEGNGQWSYAPAQAETNGNQVAFTMVLSGAVSQTVNVFPVAFDPSDSADLGVTALTGHTPQTGDSFARLGAPAGASIAADLLVIDNFVDDLESRLTAARAGYLDNLNGHIPQTGDSFARLGAPAGASIAADLLVIDNFVDELETRLTLTRANNLDELGAANIPADIDTLLARLTAARAGYLDELAAANIPADIDTLLTRATEARLAELDPANIPAVTDAIKAITDQITFTVANMVDSNITEYNGGLGFTGGDYPSTQDQVSNIVNVGAAVNTPATGRVITTGVGEVNTYLATAPLDGVLHTLNDSGGILEMYYEFDIGTSGTPVTITQTGYVTGPGDDLGVYAYNWVGTSWDQIGTLSGTSASIAGHTYALYTSHVGTGTDVGKVRIRFYASTGLTTATLATDQIYVSFATVPIVKETKGTVSDLTPTASAFDSSLTQPDNFWKDNLLIFTSGSLAGQSSPVTTYVNASGALTFDESFTSAPANGDAFIIEHTHIHPISQITSDIDANSTQLAGINTHLTDIKGTGFVKDTHSLTDVIATTATLGITKNTAFNNLEFLMVDATDFATPETGLTVTGTRSIDGGAFGAVTGTIAEVGSGIYQADLSAADTNGDVITYKFSATGAADTFLTIKTRT